MSSILRCPRCDDRMAVLLLAGHEDRVVEIDFCVACRLVWFDPIESVRLAGLGWVALLRRLQQGGGLSAPAARTADLGCPRCAAPLKTVLNRSRFGRFAALECPKGHGHLHTQGGLLAERGLVRTLLPAERQRLLARSHHLDCLNCGAPADGRSEDCAHCGSALVLLDLARLAHALTFAPQDAAPPAEGLPLPWSCAFCGAPLNPGRQAECSSCGQAAVAPSLLDLDDLLDEAEAQLGNAATERLLKAARSREQMLERPPRRRDWRDTQFERVRRLMGPEELDGKGRAFDWRDWRDWAPVLAALVLILLLMR